MNFETKASITPEDVARYPLPGLAFPGNIQFSPDDSLVSFLLSPDGTLVRQLYTFDPATGRQELLVAPTNGGILEQELSLEEKLKRERMRQHDLGITSYSWATKGNLILLPLSGGLYLMDKPGTPLREIVKAGDSPAMEARLSPDGEWLSYVRDSEIYLVPTSGGEPRQLTIGAKDGGVTHGVAEFIAQEEMGRRSGYWWSPDSRWIAYTEVDESHIPIYRIVHQGKADLVNEDHHYPFTGERNARVRLAVISVDGGEPTWMDLGDDEDIYLARVKWTPQGNLTAQIENRQQTKVTLLQFDGQTGKATVILEEVNETWINLHKMFWPLKGQDHSGGFIWASERSGYRHLYLYDSSGQLIRPLTQGEWLVESLAGVDEERGCLYFTATRESPLERHLYVTSLEGDEPRRLTAEPGTHTVVTNHSYKHFVDTHQSLDRPPSVRLRSLEDGSLVRTIFDEIDPQVEALDLKPPEVVTVNSRDGERLYGAIYRPPEEFGPAPYPTIVWVYGGPSAQLVVNGWRPTIEMRAQYLRSLGYLLFVLDNRGGSGRGLSFESKIKEKMGSVEVMDQVDGVRWLVDQGLADPERVGIYGWSYGGYMAVMCLAQAPEIFKVAVAGAPVSHWDGYDTFYTEHYMGTPQANPAGYTESSVLQHIERIRGKLLLIHGLIDENVHFRHTARLINALIKARIPYDLMLFPDERHSPRGLADRVYLEERIRDYFLENL